MDRKSSFLLYTDYLRNIQKLSMEQRGCLFTALMCYVAGEPMPDMDDRTDMAFSFIQCQIDRDTEAYEKTVEARRQAGKRGGEQNQANQANGSKPKQKVANQAKGSKAKQTQANQADNDNVYDNENDNDRDIKRESNARKSFAPPSKQEIEAYCQEKSYKVDAERFIDFYESKGWMIGKNKMKDWKAAVRNWGRQDMATKPGKPPTQNKFNNFNQRTYDFADLEQKLLGKG